MNQMEAQILEPLSKFVQDEGDFALLLKHPNGMVKFHSSDAFRSYIDLFTQDSSTSEMSESPISSNTTVVGSGGGDHSNGNKVNHKDDNKEELHHFSSGPGFIPLARALESPTFELHLSSKREIMNHLRACFRELQQLACKTIAKAWIKVIEPRKQTNYPYNRGEDSKPFWWPSHIRHCEPDHLIKSERIDLMIGIVRHKNANVKDLRDATNRIPSLDEYKLKVLDEIYLVIKAEKEEEKGLLVVSDFEDGMRHTRRKKNFKSKQMSRLNDDIQSGKSSNNSAEINATTCTDEENTTIIEEELTPKHTNTAINDTEGDLDVDSMSPSNLSLVAPEHLNNGFLTTSPKRYTFRDLVNTTPNSIKSNDENVLDRQFPTISNNYNFQFSPNRVVDPELNNVGQDHVQQQAVFENDDNIVSEVLKIRDYNIKHSSSKSISKKRKVGKMIPSGKKVIGTLGPPMYYMSPNEHVSSTKVPVFKDEGDDDD